MHIYFDTAYDMHILIFIRFNLMLDIFSRQYIKLFIHYIFYQYIYIRVSPKVFIHNIP